MIYNYVNIYIIKYRYQDLHIRNFINILVKINNIKIQK